MLQEPDPGTAVVASGERPTVVPAAPLTVLAAPTPTLAPTSTPTPVPTTTVAPTTTRPAPTPTPKPAPPAPAPAACPSTGFGGVRPHVARVGHHIVKRFGLLSAVLGLAPRPGNPTSLHPRGLALDFMVDRRTGDQIADYLLANRARFGVDHVIWRQRINYGSGWRDMASRGSATADHFDHVHASFSASAPGAVTC